MSQVERRLAQTQTVTLDALPVIAGIGMLLARLWILRTPDAIRIGLLTTVFAAILTASLLVRVTSDASHLSLAIVLGIGLAGVGLAGLTAGPPIPASFPLPAVALSLFAAVAEEALFRRAAYGWLARWGAGVAIVGSALLFAAIHVPLYGPSALPVDLGAGLLFSWQRWASGTWTAPALTHAAANVLAMGLR